MIIQKKPLFLLLPMLMIFLGILSCNRPPELPVEPRISFESIQFKEVEGQDSLILAINFEDGDGDLGLTPADIFPPYHPFDIVLDDDGDTVKIGSRPGLPDYNRIDYEIITNNAGEVIDTVLVDRNENQYNIFVRFFEKRNGQYIEFDWRKAPYYQTFDARFPLLNTDVKDGELRVRPLEGELRYAMLSVGWRIVFRDSLKLSVQIQDRALHKSNIIETPDFTLESIRVDP